MYQQPMAGDRCQCILFLVKLSEPLIETVKILGSKILSLNGDSRTFCDGEKRKTRALWVSDQTFGER
jgi:hypothetical protein